MATIYLYDFPLYDGLQLQAGDLIPVSQLLPGGTYAVRNATPDLLAKSVSDAALREVFNNPLLDYIGAFDVFPVGIYNGTTMQYDVSAVQAEKLGDFFAGQALHILHTALQEVSTIGTQNISANYLYLSGRQINLNQSLLTSSNVYFNSVQATNVSATSLYVSSKRIDVNQHLLTSSNVAFNAVATNNVSTTNLYVSGQLIDFNQLANNNSNNISAANLYVSGVKVDLNQSLLTSSNVAFNTVSTTSLYVSGKLIDFTQLTDIYSDNVSSCHVCATGICTNDLSAANLYVSGVKIDLNQSLLTNSNVIFNTTSATSISATTLYLSGRLLDLDQLISNVTVNNVISTATVSANELYIGGTQIGLNQSLLTSSNVTFNNVSANNLYSNGYSVAAKYSTTISHTGSPTLTVHTVNHPFNSLIVTAQVYELSTAGGTQRAELVITGVTNKLTGGTGSTDVEIFNPVSKDYLIVITG